MSDERIGNYRLIERIARGGMAEVWKARKTSANGQEQGPFVCIKRLDPSLKDDIDFVEMFRDEASLVLDFDHDNIIKLYELIDDSEELAMVMELVDGPSLAKVRSALEMKAGPQDTVFGMDEALQIGIYLCRALHHAHTRMRHGEPLKIVHRDVSPQNVLISTDGNVKLVDFGIAKATQRLTRTRAGALKGKCSYMAPEQVRGEGVDHRADQFAAGILMWEMLTNRRLFSGRNEVLILEQVARSDAVPPSSVKRGVPKSVDRAVLRALGWAKDERFADMQAFEQALQLCLDEWIAQDAPGGVARNSTVDLRSLVERANRAAAQSAVSTESGAMRTRIIANASTEEGSESVSRVAQVAPVATDPLAQAEHTGQFFQKHGAGRGGLIAGAMGVALVGIGVGAAVWLAERETAPPPPPPPPPPPLIASIDEASARLTDIATLVPACDDPCMPLWRTRAEAAAKDDKKKIGTHVDALQFDQCLARCGLLGAGRYVLPANDALEAQARAVDGHPCRIELIEDLVDAAQLDPLGLAALVDAVVQCGSDATMARALRGDTKKPLTERLQDPDWPKKKKRTPAVTHARTVELVRRGRLALVAGNPERAKSLLVEALTYEPHRIELHERLGNAFRALGDPVGAAHHYRLYFHAFPDDADRARAELYARRYNQSLELKPVEAPGPDERAVRTHRLLINAADKPPPDALPLLQQAQTLSPDDVAVLERLAAVYLSLQKPEDARATLERAVKLKPSKKLKDQLKAIGS